MFSPAIGEPTRGSEIRIRGPRAGRRPELDQVEDLEPVRPEQPDPVPVRQLELDRVPRLGAGRSSCGRAPARRLLTVAPAQPDQRARDVEREPTTRPEHPGDLGQREVRIREAHRPVIAEDEIEALVRERRPLGVGVDEREPLRCALHQPERVRADGSTDPARPDGPRVGPARSTTARRRTRTPARPSRPRRPARELGLRDLPDPPGGAVEAVQLGGVVALVLVRLAVPARAVPPDVAGLRRRLRASRPAHRSIHPASRSFVSATNPAAIDSAISPAGGRRDPDRAATGCGRGRRRRTPSLSSRRRVRRVAGSP